MTEAALKLESILPSPPVADRIREMLLERAGASLDYVRSVKWGEATVSYTVHDGDQVLDISVRVACARKADA